MFQLKFKDTARAYDESFARRFWQGENIVAGNAIFDSTRKVRIMGSATDSDQNIVSGDGEFGSILLHTNDCVLILKSAHSIFIFDLTENKTKSSTHMESEEKKIK